MKLKNLTLLLSLLWGGKDRKEKQKENDKEAERREVK